MIYNNNLFCHVKIQLNWHFCTCKIKFSEIYFYQMNKCQRMSKIWIRKISLSFLIQYHFSVLYNEQKSFTLTYVKMISVDSKAFKGRIKHPSKMRKKEKKRNTMKGEKRNVIARCSLNSIFGMGSKNVSWLAFKRTIDLATFSP